MIEWATFELNNTSKSIHMIDGSCSSDFSTETVTTNSSKSDLLLIHESNNIVADIVHVV